MNAVNTVTGTPARVGLYFIVKNNNVTLEENLFGILYHTGAGTETDPYILNFVPSNPVSSYIDFGEVEFNMAEAENITPTKNLVFEWRYNNASATETKYTLPLAGEDYEYSHTKTNGTTETKEVKRRGKNTTRSDAYELTKMGFSATTETAEGSFKGIADKWVYDVKFISNGGYVDEVTEEEANPKSIANGMITIAETR